MREMSNLLDDLSTKIEYKSKDVEALFKERQGEQIGLLKESISDIQKMISGRKDLHEEMLNSLDELNIFIDNSMPKGASATSEAIQARQDLTKELLKKKIEIEELKVEEKLNFWRDIAALKKELREHMKEFRDTESKTSMMDSLLDM